MRSIKTLMDMSGRFALITGGAGNLGMAMAGALAELGCQVVLLDMDKGRVDAAAKRLVKNYGVPAYGMAIDLEDESAIGRVPDMISKLGGELDVLINNAAFVGSNSLTSWCVPFAEQSASTWRRAMEVNLTAVFEITQCCEPFLKRSSHASIINVSSIYGAYGPDYSLYEGTMMGNPAAYAASKGGLNQLTRWLSTTLAPHVRVNSLSPGGVFRNQPDVFVERYKTRTPLARMATEEDLLGAVVYLASDLSLYVTGQNLAVDGGWGVW